MRGARPGHGLLQCLLCPADFEDWHPRMEKAPLIASGALGFVCVHGRGRRRVEMK